MSVRPSPSRLFATSVSATAPLRQFTAKPDHLVADHPLASAGRTLEGVVRGIVFNIVEDALVAVLGQDAYDDADVEFVPSRGLVSLAEGLITDCGHHCHEETEVERIDHNPLEVVTFRARYSGRLR